MSNTSIDVTGNTVTLNTSGGSFTVTVGHSESIADALDRNGVDVSRMGLDVLVGNQRLDASQVTGDMVTDGETLAAPPKQASLGA